MANTQDASAAKILVVEDQEDSRLALELFLQMQGYEVTSVETAEAGLEAAVDHPPDFVVTDYSLPAETGIWMLEQLVARDAMPPYGAAIVTGHPAIKGPAGTVTMQKPVDLDKLLALMAEKLAGRPTPPRATDQVDAEDAASDRVRLALYVTSGSLASHRAQRNLARLLSAYRSDGYTLDVLDVAQAHELAALDRVDFTPALVKRGPPPRAWLLGDFSNPGPLHDLMSALGMEPTHA